MLVSYGLENWCPFWCPLRTPEPPKPLLHTQLELEARVGIEQVSEQSKTTPKPFGSGSFSNCCTGKHINSNEPLNQANNAQQLPTIPSASNTLSARFGAPPSPVLVRQCGGLATKSSGTACPTRLRRYRPTPPTAHDTPGCIRSGSSTASRRRPRTVASAMKSQVHTWFRWVRRGRPLSGMTPPYPLALRRWDAQSFVTA